MPGVRGLSIAPVEEAASARVGDGLTLHCPFSYDKEKVGWGNEKVW